MGLAAPAGAQVDAQALRVRSLAASCAACHGTDGQAAAGGEMPRLAGLPADYFAAQMLAFRSGARPATVMHQISKGYSDEQVRALAGYFAARGGR
ncbi:c-type cytochrome [Aquincola sp. MAHUQ-54]|uniref:C-type cytochrome n=2 Tax=Sphaerotilaceae TaxID=2975441 RepID=A0AAW9QAW2_9BURK